MATDVNKEDVVEEKKEDVKEEQETSKSETNNEESEAAKNFTKAADDVRQTTSKALNEAFKQVETLGKALGSALQDRSNVVMVRVNNDALHYLDMMVEADVAKSRSEAAAYLINEGIKANEELFHEIRDISDKIAALKAQLRDTMRGGNG